MLGFTPDVVTGLVKNTSMSEALAGNGEEPLAATSAANKHEAAR
jgi:hypothetical protein